jgi:hypothetical protein
MYVELRKVFVVVGSRDAPSHLRFDVPIPVVVDDELMASLKR